MGEFLWCLRTPKTFFGTNLAPKYNVEAIFVLVCEYTISVENKKSKSKNSPMDLNQSLALSLAATVAWDATVWTDRIDSALKASPHVSEDVLLQQTLDACTVPWGVSKTTLPYAKFDGIPLDALKLVLDKLAAHGSMRRSDLCKKLFKGDNFTDVSRHHKVLCLAEWVVENAIVPQHLQWLSDGAPSLIEHD